MITLLGSSGYVGMHFVKHMKKLGLKYTTVSLSEIDYRLTKNILNIIDIHKPDIIINAAGYTGKPNVDSCEYNKDKTILGNVIFPLRLAEICLSKGIILGNISSGCIFTGGKIRENGNMKVIEDFTEYYKDSFNNIENNSLIGFKEEDTPNFSFDYNNCSFYSGTKALCEKELQNFPHVYQWRLRIPYSNINSPRNYITKLLMYDKVYQNINSISNIDEFANICLLSLINKIPFGIYNIVNTGFIKTSDVINMIKEILRPDKNFVYWNSNAEFYNVNNRSARSNCLLDNGKIKSYNLGLSKVEDSVQMSLENWKW